ncbi:thiamine-binding protein [Anoxynatronum sibiricum]|uniref:Thiamine-binding protein n=1 Tax=Anoxynatronum sibiricum TaxID=210623 RepID=A0ABU9VWD3_9CLOT
MSQASLSTANVSLQVLPSVPPDDVYPVVDKVIEMIAASGVTYEVGPMETTMEGDLDTLLDLVKKAQELCIEAGAGSVMSIVKIHYKPKGVTIHEKVGKYRG